jgi:hypothetical protein
LQRVRGDPDGDVCRIAGHWFNAMTAFVWEHQERSGVTLHRATNCDLRAEHLNLFYLSPLQLVILARMTAAEALRSLNPPPAKSGGFYP